MLHASGELRLEMGGLPIFPEMNIEAAMIPRHIMGSVSPAYQPSRTRDERHRRSIYAYRYRGLSDPWMEAFNQPDANAACETREASIVTPQAFALMNSRSSQDRSLAMAAQIEAESPERRGQIERAFQRAFSRSPTNAEQQSAQRYLKAAQARHEANPPTPYAYPTSIEREMFEEMTGEPFVFTERLDIYENYEADMKPWEAAPSTRALADLCLLLLNANELIYIY